ncbi:MAG: nucleotidyltransferase family protein [Campylobacterales bacterium]|nr:nucleotidyltransferase family protein [Campylobacterales bacterium]
MRSFSNELQLILESSRLRVDEQIILNLLKNIDWEFFIHLAYMHGVLPVVYKTLKVFKDNIPQNFFEKLSLLYKEIACNNLIATSELLKVVTYLQNRGVDVIAFKGPLLSDMAYGDITLRQYADIDILVPQEQLLKLSNLLIKEGYTSPSSTTLLEDKSFLELNNDFNFYSSNNIHIEVHWKLIREQITLYEQNTIFENSSSQFLQGVMLKTLNIEMNIIYLALHGSKHGWERIEWINDLYYLIEKFDVDWNRVLRLTEHFQCKPSLLLGIGLVGSLYGIQLPIFLKESLENSATEIAIEKVYGFLRENIVLEENYKKYQKINLFQFRLINSKKRKTIHFFNTYFAISRNDHLTIGLPSKLYFLYYFIRPFRVFFKFFIKRK